MATQSPSAERPRISRPAASNAALTSASRSTKIPDATSVPPGRSSSRSSAASVDQQAGDEVREDDVERPPRRDGRLPSRAPDGRRGRAPVAARVRRGRLDRDRVGVDAEDARLRPACAAAIARIPEPQPDVEAPGRRRAARGRPIDSTPPGTAGSSGGGRSRTPSPGRGRGRRRPGGDGGGATSAGSRAGGPTRSTGKCAFQASAQSASWTSRVVSSPIGRSPNAWRWPSASVASATARAAAAASRAGT